VDTDYLLISVNCGSPIVQQIKSILLQWRRRINWINHEARILEYVPSTTATNTNVTARSNARILLLLAIFDPGFISHLGHGCASTYSLSLSCLGVGRVLVNPGVCLRIRLTEENNGISSTTVCCKAMNKDFQH